ncbi:ParB/RepB/Spo0J family partition protein [Candidatus Manganitrophus noduliformans]|uniref:ParB/RepB/Spo0J family partition protein n=1 Tax=Candidatus Manganitrophus noduliformans TaxID=2606439 RepID=A0A7X6DT02_9BACT|nr:ParB/RepB/Spo0J family partition protein [Candidatus Manganitrophus noduliformans]NKE72815.1 ParB/RepB/Spo0J family partition protein [Candidatus Manganitrophus noduliformans]
MIEEKGEAEKDRAEPEIDELIDLLIKDPKGLSLEEGRRVYQHFLDQVDPISRQAETLREAIEEIDGHLERVKRGDPNYLITPQGTFFKPAVEIRVVPTDQLIPDTNYQDLFRDMEGEDFEQLKASIQENGIIQPIIVDPKMGVICGHQRLRAAKEIGLPSIPVVVRSVEKEETRGIMAIEENIRRRQLQPSEMARAVKKLTELEERKNRADLVAKEINLSRSQTYRYRDLSALIPEISSLLDGGKLTQQTALQIAQLDEDVQRVLYEALGERISGQKVDEFKRANADLIKQAERLNVEIERRKARETKLEAEKNRLQNDLEQAKSEATDEITRRLRLEEELKETRAESYQKLQEKQAVLDKITRNAEPKVVPPPDYKVVKEENAKLRTELKELKGKGGRHPDVILTELYGVFTGQILSVDLEAMKGKPDSSIRALFFPLMPRIKTWIDRLEELIEPQTKPR